MLPPSTRRVILDADINWKLVYELRKRGRHDATAAYVERIHTLKDGALLKHLSEQFEPCVLVTWDNKMPKVHAAELTHFRSTVAVVNQSGLATWPWHEEAYVRNAVHRWLHLIELQPAGSIALYSTVGVARPK